MNPKQLLVAAVPAAFTPGPGAAIASKTMEEAGTLACVTDKWEEKEPEKGIS